MASDELFASFLAEVEAEANEPAEPPNKRFRTEKEAAGERQQIAETLRKAAFHGQLSKVRQVLQGLDCVDRLLLVDSSESDGLTALHLATIGGHNAICDALLGGRADIDARSSQQDTPLMWAAHLGHSSVCQLLLHKGADASLRNAAGQTAAMQAQHKGFRKIKDILESHVAKPPTGAQTDPSAARRAANLAAVAAAVREEAERKEEDQFWSKIRERRERREAEGDKEDFKEFLASTAHRFAKQETAPKPSIPGHMRRHYALLEIGVDASEIDVRKAYRKLALRHHPDKNPHDPDGATKRFAEVAVAYETICGYLTKV